ncbi:sugar phosphate nucleotidyltransferase [Terribacillus sp. 179-K 1B1 HS]|uniref:sugar phosphate nucleotidyltransferase n=1 Tax=Terribacillus sp. 179-K 1B1 HS TaxID=3142388 RepID=UPI00399FC739
MNLVLLSGGSGKRLWPLSNDARSKQFLKLLNDEENQPESMLQRVWNQISKSGLSENAVIATSKSQVEIMYNQLGSDIALVTEPYRRDTFPAIALAVSFLYSEKKVPINETVTVMPVDPYVEDFFFEKISLLEDALINSNADLALMGVKPSFPSQKYGYIVPEIGSYSSENSFVPVNYFKEKPDAELASELINQGALWNCGVFSFKLSFVLDYLEELKIPTDYNILANSYDMLPKNSFDYEIVERAQNIVVQPYEGYWKDLGTWNTLTEEMNSNIIGKAAMSEELKNSHIINELQIPVVMMGIENAIVAASPDGILVTNKERSPEIKKYAEMFSDRPMFEERRWGWYKVLEHNKYDEGNQVLTRRLWVESGKNISYQIHFKRTEVWTLVKGEGLLILDNNIQHIRAGDTIKIPLGKKHALKAITDMEIIEIQVGSELTEDDVTRFSYEWDDIMSQITQHVNI